MHDLTSDWQIFGGKFQAQDIDQGSLGNCYLLSALASMVVHKNGEYIKNVFVTQVIYNFIRSFSIFLNNIINIKILV